jgi:hypothetical protein
MCTTDILDEIVDGLDCIDSETREMIDEETEPEIKCEYIDIHIDFASKPRLNEKPSGIEDSSSNQPLKDYCTHMFGFQC